MASRIVFLILIASSCCASQAAAQKAGPIKVLSYDTDEPVDELLVYGRFLNGTQLRTVYELLGVEPETIAAEKERASKELFIMLRIEATDKARGVLSLIELEIANDSPILRQHHNLKVPALHDGGYLLIEKLCDATQPRDGSLPGIGVSKKSSRDKTDYVDKLNGEIPVLRIRSMVTK